MSVPIFAFERWRCLFDFGSFRYSFISSNHGWGDVAKDRAREADSDGFLLFP